MTFKTLMLMSSVMLAMVSAPAMAEEGQSARWLNPQPLPPIAARWLNPQPLPPVNARWLNPQPLPPMTAR